MKLRDYLASKAVMLCGIGIALIVWGVFAYLCGANAVLLWGSEAFFVVAVVVRYSVGYAVTNSRLKRLQKSHDELDKKYLLGTLLPKPPGSVEREYYEIMSSVSRSAIGEAENAQREKEEYCEFVEQWIHELKTPLTACSLICDNGGDKSKLKRELKRADNIADTALYYARLRSPENDTVIAAIDLRKVLDDAVISQRELLTAAKISVEINGGFTVDTDGKAVGFVVKQLLINCAKYCAGCHIVMTAENGVLSIADNGVGIASDELPLIMRRGYTGTEGRRIGSTGMGLYISSEICKRLEIDFTARSEVGKGTTFYLKFPNLTKS
ncbi:MAG: HAMP domain-containing histidine kinase [Clostridiales bacterium]|nr:HAMP domain-containing histidine kinase [Clostridiales bacterium]